MPAYFVCNKRVLTRLDLDIDAMIQFELEPIMRPVMTGASAIIVDFSMRILSKNPENPFPT